jgi:hypothetical protein
MIGPCLPSTLIGRDESFDSTGGLLDPDPFRPAPRNKHKPEADEANYDTEVLMIVNALGSTTTKAWRCL